MPLASFIPSWPASSSNSKAETHRLTVAMLQIEAVMKMLELCGGASPTHGFDAGQSTVPPWRGYAPHRG
jgi:hypothetical protein